MPRHTHKTTNAAQSTLAAPARTPHAGPRAPDAAGIAQRALKDTSPHPRDTQDATQHTPPHARMHCPAGC